MPVDPNKEQLKMCERPGCPNHLRGKQRRFCSNSCRATASNMEKTAEARMLAESMALESIRAKLEPVTRELLTDDVLRELKSLVELLPEAVQTMAALMRQTDDPELAFKAADRLLKMTVGNSSIAPAGADKQSPDLTVIIGGGMESNPNQLTSTVVINGESIEMRECVECHISKTPDEFVGESARCRKCHQELVDRATEKYGADLVRSVKADDA